MNVEGNESKDGKNADVGTAEIPENATDIRFANEPNTESIVDAKLQQGSDFNAKQGQLYYIFSHQVDDNFMGTKPPMEATLNIESKDKDEHSFSIEFINEHPVDEFNEDGAENVEYFYKSNNEDEDVKITEIKENVWDTSKMTGGQYTVYAVLKDKHDIHYTTPEIIVN